MSLVKRATEIADSIAAAGRTTIARFVGVLGKLQDLGYRDLTVECVGPGEYLVRLIPPKDEA